MIIQIIKAKRHYNAYATLYGIWYLLALIMPGVTCKVMAKLAGPFRSLQALSPDTGLIMPGIREKVWNARKSHGKACRPFQCTLGIISGYNLYNVQRARKGMAKLTGFLVHSRHFSQIYHTICIINGTKIYYIYRSLYTGYQEYWQQRKRTNF